MISVFESGLSKDRVPFKPGRKSNRFGSSHLWKDDTVEKPDTHLKNSEVSSSTRLRSCFSTGDLTKNLASVITKDDQVEVDEDFVESAEIVVKVSDLISLGKNCIDFCVCQNVFQGEVIESADKETSNGSFGQAMKIALVIGFGVVAFLFRQRDTGKGKKENTRASRNIVLMNKRGSIEDQRRRIRVSWST
ncbi:hypothetical protein QVD17_26523 [Tagetes erecta]|uniref:Uncharacterized protein n=1 Tax=Tagetes erecta TaxID=13708 RepID=A0AAD8K9K9_TARER|nr:hypothetical protein QVD17_26523 [Tagetes erecta]